MEDRKSTRLNSSHSQISYAVFCLKKKKKTESANGVHLEGVASDNRNSRNGNKTTNLTSKEAKMRKVMRHTLRASLNIRHNLSSSKGPKPLQLKLLTTYIPKTSAFIFFFKITRRPPKSTLFPNTPFSR